ncbi:MAG: hypothetical protein IPP49_16700 [Saprospiraceae bacterium]|nr:hypothetical protein [Saprospiraceae bacterium]
MSKNLSHLSGRKGLENNLFEQLGISAQKNGTVDAGVMDRIQAEFLIDATNIYAVEHHLKCAIKYE